MCEAITKVPAAKPEVVAAQIHDASDDVLQIRLEGQKLMVQYNDGKSEQVLDPDYKLGTPYHVRIIAADSKVDVLYNGAEEGRAAADRVGLVLEGRRLRPAQHHEGRRRGLGRPTRWPQTARQSPTTTRSEGCTVPGTIWSGPRCSRKRCGRRRQRWTRPASSIRAMLID